MCKKRLGGWYVCKECLEGWGVCKELLGGWDGTEQHWLEVLEGSQASLNHLVHLWTQLRSFLLKVAPDSCGILALHFIRIVGLKSFPLP